MKIIEIEENILEFDNGYKLEAYHEQDCCENVYADFTILNSYNLSTTTGKTINIKNIEFEESLETLIQGVEGAGFNMISKIGEKFFVACYNEQNGYYSSNLELILHKKNNVKEHLDVSGFVKDEIY